MELQIFHNGYVPSFPFDEFRKNRDIYDSGPFRKEWTNIEELRSFLAMLDMHSLGQIVGHISAETALEWRDWKWGKLYVVGWHRNFVLCVQEGLVAG